MLFSANSCSKKEDKWSLSEQEFKHTESDHSSEMLSGKEKSPLGNSQTNVSEENGKTEPVPTFTEKPKSEKKELGGKSINYSLIG